MSGRLSYAVCGSTIYIRRGIDIQRTSIPAYGTALRDWEAGFTEHELKVLAEFHKVFDAESEALPIDWPDWDKDAGWLRVREAARHALSQL